MRDDVPDHGVLDLVSTGVGVALVPASAALLGVGGVRVRALRRRAAGEVLCLLRRKVDPNPLVALTERLVEQIFARVEERAALALRA